MSNKVRIRNETYRSVGGEKGEALQARKGGEALQVRRGGKVLPKWRNRSVADAEKSKSTVITTSGIVANGSYRHWLQIVVNGLLGLCSIRDDVLRWVSIGNSGGS